MIYLFIGALIHLHGTNSNEVEIDYSLILYFSLFMHALFVQKYDRRDVPRHEENLQDIEKFLGQVLGEAFSKAQSYQLQCQARLGKSVWLGELIQHSQTDDTELQLHEFEGPPRFVNRRPQLKNEFYTRCSGISCTLSLNYFCAQLFD